MIKWNVTLSIHSFIGLSSIQTFLFTFQMSFIEKQLLIDDILLKNDFPLVLWIYFNNSGLMEFMSGQEAAKELHCADSLRNISEAC